MNYVDAVLIAIMALALWGGWAKGFIWGLVDLLTLLGSLAAAIYFYPYVEAWFNTLIHGSVWIRPLSFLTVFILARVLLSVVLNLILKNVTQAAHVSTVNRILGLIPGLINGLIYSAILSALFLAMPLSEALTAKTRSSRVAPKLALQVEWLEDKLAPVFNEAVKRSMNKVTVEPESKTTINLGFTVEDTKVRPDLEDKMLTLINAERMKRKLRALVADFDLLPVARAHSIDMFAQGYFSHQTPKGATPADRVKKAGVRYLMMGENLALGQTLTICHQGLMNSPGHRANILNPTYGRIGIGIIDGGVHGLMVTQEFRN